ncbi:uncharacterized protein A1O5_11031 [Cladophialophora psammophila CBS 110553]|uniref:Uncharacterized protein n=1 Tax=Cladophialophora psammophila CBS 110553 TaxID=1182543 RepID=W9WLB0_9EURO|nr:uncharacterized protein A1O5_11031 [Cladophialophora psammophila CBS 110553]EXJ65790.1 hypothetical protein A1O5_11031 [Cladophialophora psammophila CBS 110553]
MTGGDTTHFVKNPISGAYGPIECDENSKSRASLQRNTDCGPPFAQGLPFSICLHEEKCSQSVTGTGNYGNTDESDYMSTLIQTTMAKATRGGAGNPNQAALVNILSLLQIVIDDQTGSNRAEMTLSIDAQCSNVSLVDSGCDGLLGTITSAVLGEIPGVGEFVAPAFDITCEALGN